jgi:hypothetical protein
MAVKNLAEFNRQMTLQIPAAILATTRAGIEETIGPLVSEMKSLAPYDEKTSPGRRRHPVHVRDSIRAKWVDDKKAENSALALKMVIIAGSAETEVLASKQRGKRFQLARLIEFGTQRHPARPFFFPVWRAHRRVIRRKISARVNQVILAYSASGTSSGDIAA